MGPRWKVLTMTDGEGSYVFRHEADIELQSLCADFESGRLSEQQAREALKPYEDAGFVEMAYFGDDGDFDFPFACDDPEFRPATRTFEQDVVDLGIAGASIQCGTFGDSWLEVEDDEVLEMVQEGLGDKYEIVWDYW